MRQRRIFTVLATVVAGATAPTAAGSDVDIEGRVRAGFKTEALKRGESFHEAQVTLETDRKKGVRAVIQFEAESDEEQFQLEEALIEKEYEDESTLEFGFDKKAFGREYVDSHDDRLTINRTPIYDKMQSFGYVGRDFALRYFDEEQGPWRYAASLGYTESNDANTIGSVSRELTENGPRLGGYLLLQSDRIDDRRQMVWASIASFWADNATHRYELEVITGQDPFESEFQKTFGDGENVHYYGGKVLYALNLWMGEDTGFQPLVGGSLMEHDVEIPGYNTISGVTGINWFLLEDLRIAGNVQIIGTNSRLDLSERSFGQSTIEFEAMYSW